jgi:hypothetical protein
MNIRKLFTGGEPDVRLDQILFGSNDDLRNALYASLASYSVGTNPNFIIDGCVVSVGGAAPNNTWSLTSGYIWLNDEILQVDAQSGTYDSSTQFLAFSKNTTYRADGDKTFVDATPRQTLEQNRGIITVQGSVSVTELDAIDGDTIDVKLKLYIGDASVTNKGVVEKATEAERNAKATDKYIDAALLHSKGGPTWQTPTFNSGFTSNASRPFRYRINRGKLEFRGSIDSASATTGVAFTLPVDYRPDYQVDMAMFQVTSSVVITYATIQSDGDVFSGDWELSGTGTNYFNQVIIMD